MDSMSLSGAHSFGVSIHLQFKKVLYLFLSTSHHRKLSIHLGDSRNVSAPSFAMIDAGANKVRWEDGWCSRREIPLMDPVLSGASPGVKAPTLSRPPPTIHSALRRTAPLRIQSPSPACLLVTVSGLPLALPSGFCSLLDDCLLTHAVSAAESGTPTVAYPHR